MNKRSKLVLRSMMVARIRVPDTRRVELSGVTVRYHSDTELVVARPNAFVNQGLELSLDELFGLTSNPVSHIGVSGDTSAVTASTTTLGTPNSIKTISPAASRTDQTVTGGADWDEGDVNFAITKVGFLNGSAPTDVVNIIGGSGGAAPYDEEFTIDLTAFSTFDLAIDIQTTAAAS